MSILKIARLGHPVLKKRADEVEDPTAPEIAALVKDMVETMADAGGVGLAAPQVHVSKRLVVFHVPIARALDEKYQDAGLSDDDGKIPLTVFINPIIEAINGEEGEDLIEGFEGCLSVPGMTGAVKRHNHIRYSALGLDGKAITGEAKGFHARVIQHECDHLDGILYPQRMEDMSKFGFSEEMRRYAIAANDEEDEE